MENSSDEDPNFMWAALLKPVCLLTKSPLRLGREMVSSSLFFLHFSSPTNRMAEEKDLALLGHLNGTLVETLGG